jgi:hypothetical protein
MTKTSSSVKPRVVIFHMTASQLVRSIAPLSEARAVPNVVTHASDGKVRVLAERRFTSKMLKGSKLSIVLAEEVGAQYVKHSRALSHHYLGGYAIMRVSAGR